MTNNTLKIHFFIITLLVTLSLASLSTRAYAVDLGATPYLTAPSAPATTAAATASPSGTPSSFSSGMPSAIPPGLSKEDLKRMAEEAAKAQGIQTPAPAVPKEAVQPAPVQTEEEKPAPRAGEVKAPEQAAQAEASTIEKAMSAGYVTVDKTEPQTSPTRNLLQFGYGFFRQGAPGFAPLTDIPVGPDYVIGPGDRIILNSWGSLEGTFELEVNRSGEIILPKAGAVRVWGVTFERLPELLRGGLARVYKDFQINVTMGKLKVIKVYVVGEVDSPGDYNLSSLSTVINALSAAGGPLKTGSLRSITVKRGGKAVETVDLYDFFLKGDKSRDIRLQPGDAVFVPVIGPVAGITGDVKRPAIYELNGEKTLKDLIGMAGGLLPTGSIERIQISRVDAYQKRSVTDVSLDPKGTGKPMEELTASIAVQDMDMVNVFPIDSGLRGYVRLEGHVLRPGDYALKPGMHIKDLVRPEELLPEYYQDGAELTRLYPPDLHPEKKFFNLGKAEAGDPDNDLELKEFDTVRVFSRWEMEEMPKVTIGGEVQKPGQYRFFTGMTVRDLLTLAGNPKRTAYLRNAEIDRIDKTKESVTSYPMIIDLSEAMNGNPKDNIPLAPFDELTVRKIPNWTEETDRYITIKGEVMFPGTYPIFRGEKLSSALERAGGYTGKAYLKGAKFTRVLVQAEQQKRMDEVIARSEDEIARRQGEILTVAASKEELDATKAALASLMQSVQRLKGVKAEGRMVIHLASLDKLKDSPYDLEIMGGDVLTIPQTPQSVNVLGQVYTPTTFVHIPGKDVEYYLNLAGGPTPEADAGDMYIIRADGTVQSRKAEKGFFLFGEDFMSTGLNSGDTIVVPQELEKIAWMREIKDIASILGQVALMAGVLVAAGL